MRESIARGARVAIELAHLRSWAKDRVTLAIADTGMPFVHKVRGQPIT